LLALAACTPKPSASDACAKIVAAGIGTGCHEVPPLALNARANHKFDFDLVGVKGKTGGVMSFDSKDAYDATVKGFEAAAVLAGPYRYGNEKALIFAQANSGLSLADGNKLRSVIEGL